jgi:hypothetical protein
MTETPLRPAMRDETTQALAFALQYDGRKRTRDTADYMARIAAERLTQYLEQSGFVLMKRPPGKAPSVP